MTVETASMSNSRESPSKSKRKRASRSSSSGSSSSGSSSSSSASSRSSSSSSTNSSSSSSRSSSASTSPEKKITRNPKASNDNRTSGKRSSDHDGKHEVSSRDNQTRGSPSAARRQEKEPESTRVYIGRLSLNVNKDHLTEIFSTFGTIKEVDLVPHRIHAHLHRGYAHIEFATPESAQQASKYMDGGQIDGREIVCALMSGAPSQVSNDRSRRDPSPYRPRRRSPPRSSRYYPASRRPGDRDRDRGRYNDRRAYSPPPRSYRRGPSPGSGRRSGPTSGNAESPKKKERRYSRSSSSESK